ncbi:MAG: toluene tolerance protein [Rhodospirillaceae bacterium]|jgi:phospholipid transport system substrate-binding protein|nr:toluene tolerance protein [Rhodospirillaceae bacterium]MBT5674891.1 toluene tolerance protein [Rhodospirillaceae bacterium]MBT5778495.1 toluene tolerance protein [Rhodospirillaceae bacterium]
MQRRILIVILVAFCLIIGSAAQAAEKSASEVVNALHASLLEMMKDADALGFDGRSKFIEPVVTKSFNLPLIAVMAAGEKNWKTFSKAQKKQLIAALEDLSVATYAARFNGYSGENFRTLSEQPADQGTTYVSTELTQGDGGTIPLKYLLYPGDSGWRIVDVVFMGVFSELAMRRSEYGAIYKKGGFDGLLTALKQKTADYQAGLLQ